MSIDVLGTNWHSHLRSRIRDTRETLFICSPYVTIGGCRLIKESLSPQFASGGKLSILSDLSPVHLIQQSTDPRALQELVTSVSNSLLWHLPRVHAKVFIFDRAYAVVTSANLTAGGLFRNIELGLGVVDPKIVTSIHDELCSFGALGARIQPAQLEKYCALAAEVQAEVQAQLRKVMTAAKSRLTRALRSTEDELIRWRASGGRVTPLFANTILFLLERRGPMTTQQIHPLVQEIHSDLCDDSVDRVIDGVHYGKRWKHWVRSAQHKLKNSGQIHLVDGMWKRATGANERSTHDSASI